MLLAMSSGVVPRGTSRTEPSGSWILIWLLTGIRIDVSERGRYAEHSLMMTFELKKATRQGSSNKVERVYWDFCPDGECIFRGEVEGRDLCSVLWLDPPVREEQGKAVLRLLKELPGDFPDGRVALYICPECGDLGCGAITAKISVDNHVVSWSDFGYENTYEDTVFTAPLSAIGPFTFELRAYEMTLRSLIA